MNLLVLSCPGLGREEDFGPTLEMYTAEFVIEPLLEVSKTGKVRRMMFVLQLVAQSFPTAIELENANL